MAEDYESLDCPLGGNMTPTELIKRVEIELSKNLEFKVMKLGTLESIKSQ